MRRTVKKVIAGTIVMMMAAVIMFSVFFIAAEADHDCEGEECHICATIKICNGILRQAGGAKALAVTCAVALFIMAVTVLPHEDQLAKETPVSSKVQLND